jgi:8-oxo-dGTP pyrophosphatase MutT (NUDIX family)
MPGLSCREITCAIILDVEGGLLPGILHPGKVMLFGGHLEGNETFLECAVREIEAGS